MSLEDLRLDLNLSPSPLALPDRIIEGNAVDFVENFNQNSFMFPHNLAGHPLFEIPRLAELSKTILSKGGLEKVQSYVSHSPVEQKWTDRAGIDQVTEAISRIEESGSWVMLMDVQVDPEYAALLEQVVPELENLVGVPLRKEMSCLGAYIFIASPHAITPYHIDHEVNFLFQIHGNKDANLFDSNDRYVLTEQEIEAFYMGNSNAANYGEEKQSKASVYQLIPGKGVHHPTLAPHWVKNGNSVSVTLSILFFLKSYDLKARVYQVNHYLRKLGLTPTAPGRSPLLDRIKIQTMGLFCKRHPVTKNEIMRSGVDRTKSIIQGVAAPARLIQRFLSS
jgi:hypothetical protein